MLINFLRKELADRKTRNSSYSIRSFARSLNLDPATLTQILNRKRKLTHRTADQILARLPIDPALKSELLLSLHQAPLNHQKFEKAAKELDPSACELLAGWEHFAILSLMETRDFKSETRWIAEKLGLTVEQTRSSLRKLEVAELIRQERRRWKLMGTPTITPRKQAKATLRKIHHEYLLKAIEALAISDLPDGQQDVSGITMAIPTRKLSEAIRRIKDFRRSMAQFLCGDEPGPFDSVYRLNIQLFPLTRTRDRPSSRQKKSSKNTTITIE